MKRFFIVTNLLSIVLLGVAQNPNCYRVYLSNKNNSTYSINTPSAFLSPRAIAKRVLYNIPVITQDLPVNESYVAQIKAYDSNIQVLATSKWLNTVVIYCPNSAHIPGIQNLGCVRYIEPVANLSMSKEGAFNIPQTDSNDKFGRSDTNSFSYGDSYDQIKVHRGELLHNAGFSGEGMLIAVLDAGWNGFDTISHFQPLYANGQIWGTRDLIPGVNNVYTGHGHGTSVTSIIASNIEGELVGTAPMANYFFIRSENPWSEQPIEEDFWVAGAELADSIGADVINSSLGYTTFADFPAGDMTPQQNDGITGVSSQAATIAGQKGIVVIVSAGNERNSNWGFIGRPADAIDIISVAAMDKDSIIAPFSSYGPSADGRVKPDITSLGWNTWNSSTDGTINQGSGTSFSGPVIAGLAACLWQSLPHLNSIEIMEVIRQHGHLFNNPNADFGYGIPDFYQAFLDNSSSVTSYSKNFNVIAYPNPTSDMITFKSIDNENISIQIVDMMGKVLVNQLDVPSQTSISLAALSSGIYFAHIKSLHSKGTIKFIKR